MTTVSGIEDSYERIREYFGDIEVDLVEWAWHPPNKLTFSTEFLVEEDQYEEYADVWMPKPEE